MLIPQIPADSEWECRLKKPASLLRPKALRETRIAYCSLLLSTVSKTDNIIKTIY